MEIKNNISRLFTNGLVHVDNDNPAGVTWNKNNFYGGDDDIPVGDAGATDVTGDPNLDVGATDFRALTAGELDGTEFKPSAADGAGVGTGVSITDYNYRISNTSPNTTDFSATPIVVSVVDGGSDAPDIGAWLYGEGEVSDPTYPLQGVKLEGKYN